MKATMDYEDFNRIIAAEKVFVGNIHSQPQHSLIQLQFKAAEYKVTAYAVNRYIAGKECACCYEIDSDFTACIKVPPLKAKSIVTIENDGQNTYVSFDDMRFCTAMPDDEFMNVEKVIAEDLANATTFKIGVNVDYMIAALKSLKSGGASVKKPVVMRFSNPLSPVVLSIHGEDNTKIVLPVRIRQED